MTNLMLRFMSRVQATLATDRGDVPGWVLITVMTAGLVTMLWTLADGTLHTLFTRAMSAVTGP
jgi:hypothetical protein